MAAKDYNAYELSLIVTKPNGAQDTSAADMAYAQRMQNQFAATPAGQKMVQDKAINDLRIQLAGGPGNPATSRSDLYNQIEEYQWNEGLSQEAAINAGETATGQPFQYVYKGIPYFGDANVAVTPVVPSPNPFETAGTRPTTAPEDAWNPNVGVSAQRSSNQAVLSDALNSPFATGTVTPTVVNVLPSQPVGSSGSVSVAPTGTAAAGPAIAGPTTTQIAIGVIIMIILGLYLVFRKGT